MENMCWLLDDAHTFTSVQRPIPTPADDEVVISVIANGICGSDVHFYAEGRLGNFKVTIPYAPGHEASGIITQVGKAIRNFREGDAVVIEPGIPCGHCELCKSGRYNLCPSVTFLSAPPIDGTFQSYIAIRSDCVHHMKPGMTFRQGAMVEPTAVAIHAANRAGNISGKSCLIFGAGAIGLLLLQVCKTYGAASVTCVDLIDARLQTAKSLGADETILLLKGQGSLTTIADIVFETAGSDTATATLFESAKVGGTVVQVGWPQSDTVLMKIACFLDKELVYTSVNRYANVFPRAIELISSKQIDVDAVVTNVFPFEQTAEAFEFTQKKAHQVVKTVVERTTVH